MTRSKCPDCEEFRKVVVELDGQLKDLVRAETALYQAQRRVDSQLEIYRRLGETSQAFAGCPDRKAIFRLVTEFAIYTLGFQRAVVLHLGEDSHYEVMAFEGWYEDASPPLGIRFPAELSLLARIAREQGMIHASRGDEGEASHPSLFESLDVETLTVIPFSRGPIAPQDILVAGKTSDPRGIYGPHPPTPDVALGLSNLVTVAGTAISNVEFYEALVTERRRLGEKTRDLHEAKEDFERRLDERTRVLERRFEELRKAQRLEAVGRLAGGVAHDFNNILTIIKGNAEYLSESIAPTHEGQIDIEAILRASDRAADLITQLLAFSRSQAIEARPLDLNRLLSATRMMLSRIIGEAIDLQLNIERELWTIRADPTQIEQVIVNLALNARDAMPRGGILRFVTGNRHVTPDEAERGPVKNPGDYVVVSVSDTGSGIDESVLPFIFDPFFTTKELHRGTGLGLASVYGILKQNSGWIDVRSLPGRGTTFHVFFPRVRETARDLPPPSPALRRSVHRGDERILLVEDDARIRAVTRKTLERWGYLVREAADGHEALKICEEVLEAFDLLLLDVVLPRMGASELLRRLPNSHARTRVLFVSGYTDTEDFDREGLPKGTAFLEKPFASAHLSRVLRDLLNGPTRDGPDEIEAGVPPSSPIAPPPRE